jgi:hypothetical protein
MKFWRVYLKHPVYDSFNQYKPFPATESPCCVSHFQFLFGGLQDHLTASSLHFLWGPWFLPSLLKLMSFFYETVLLSLYPIIVPKQKVACVPHSFRLLRCVILKQVGGYFFPALLVTLVYKRVLTNIASRIFFLISSIFCFFSLKKRRQRS